MIRALVVVALAGCAAKDVAELDIPCMTDDDCPSGEWCNVPVKQCQGKVAPPHIVFDNVPPSGHVAVMAKTHQFTGYKLTVRNDGEPQVELEVTSTGPTGLGAGAGREDAGVLDPGRSLDLDLDVFPDPGCPSPSSFTVSVDASGRKFAVTYDVTILPP